ncbi:putative WRKY transcription factor 57 [Panicum miliaceum]|uniref:WRKY transcription factor 57 n=1 Tax=Panicum miliaceum TaxID=4540 RepID=A0A3L6SNZ3_PANMI|nr:putative WRKY transcription factor 57 [Panicum miliaceum]
MALASCDSIPAADAACFFPAMAYPCDGGLAASAFYYGGARNPAAALFSQPQLALGGAAPAGLAPPRRQPDAAFECLSEEGVPSVVPGTFGTPPPRMPVEQAVPDVSGYAHHAR